MRGGWWDEQIHCLRLGRGVLGRRQSRWLFGRGCRASGRGVQIICGCVQERFGHLHTEAELAVVQAAGYVSLRGRAGRGARGEGEEGNDTYTEVGEYKHLPAGRILV